MEQEIINVSEIFGEYVFNDAVMQQRLPKKVYQKLQETLAEGGELDLETADVIVFMVDAKQGLTDADFQIASMLKKSRKRYVSNTYLYFITILTILFGTTITLTISLPSIFLITTPSDFTASVVSILVCKLPVVTTKPSTVCCIVLYLPTKF